MRNLFSILNLILCFELMVSPIAPNMSLISVARAEGCPAGLQMDPTLNRCLTTAQTANVMNATAACAQGDTSCYRQNAEKAFQDKVNAGEAPERKGNMGFVSKIANIAAIAGPVTIAVMNMSGKQAKCSSPSYYAMIAGAAALVIGDNLANFQHKKRLKKIKEDWGKVVNPEDAGGNKDKEREKSIEAQSESFEMLARAEDSLAAAAKMKKMFFMVATLAYGASAVIAAMEIMKNKALKTKTLASLKAVETAAGTIDTTSPQVTPIVGTGPSATTAGTNASTAAKAAVAAVQAATAKHEAADKNQSGTANQVAEQTKVTIHAAAAKMKTAAGTLAFAGTTANMAVLTATPPPPTPNPSFAFLAQATAHQAAVTSLSTAVTNANAATSMWEAHSESTLCVDIGKPADAPAATGTQFNINDSQSIYSYYSGGNKFLDLRQDLQFRYNLENSEDMASFIINKKQMDGSLSSPLDEYATYKYSTAALDSEDRTAFEAFKATSLVVLNLMNPMNSAHAVEELQDSNSDVSDGGAGGSGGGSGTNPGSNVVGNVETNAAKAYKEDKAQGIDLMSIGIGAVGGYVLAKTVGDKLVSSTGRLIFSGVMAGMTLMMANHAGSQAEASTKRAELLRKMKNEFNQAAGAVNACGSADRDDPGKPTCYCYTPENQRNNNRGNSAVCQKLWAGISIKPTNYLSGTQSGKICISNSNKADPTCACKQTKTCLKVGMSGLTGLNAGTMSMLGQSLGPVNGVVNGSVDAANLNAAGMATQAAKMSSLLKDLENNKALGDYKKNKGKLEAKLMNDLNRGAASLSPNSMLGGGSGSNIPSNPKDAALMLEKELDQPLPTGIAGGDQIMAPTNSPAEEGLEFGMTADQLAEQEGQIAEVMNQDLDYGGNDINQGSKTNIFDVLSNRYQRSGMRRLFDEKGTTEAEKPAATDIAQ